MTLHYITVQLYNIKLYSIRAPAGFWRRGRSAGSPLAGEGAGAENKYIYIYIYIYVIDMYIGRQGTLRLAPFRFVPASEL